jgi:hypothetical protein
MSPRRIAILGLAITERMRSFVDISSSVTEAPAVATTTSLPSIRRMVAPSSLERSSASLVAT